MRSVFWTLRRVAMVALAVASVAGAAALTWMFVAGGESGDLSTAHLAAILALAVLPLATLGAWVLDGRTAREQVRNTSTLEDNGLFEMPGGIEVEEVEERATEPVRKRQVHQPHRRRHGGRAAGRRK